MVEKGAAADNDDNDNSCRPEDKGAADKNRIRRIRTVPRALAI